MIIPDSCKIIPIVFLIIFIFSCTSSRYSTYSSDYPMTKEVVSSQSDVLYVKVPEGWYSVLDNDGKGIDLWLVKEDYSASLNFMAINVDNPGQKSNDDGLKSILYYSKVLKKADMGESFKTLDEDEYFQINSINCGAYKYLSKEGLPVRVVVFKYGESYFEMTALPVRKTDGEYIDPDELFRVQNSVIASINLKI